MTHAKLQAVYLDLGAHVGPGVVKTFLASSFFFGQVKVSIFFFFCPGKMKCFNSVGYVSS